MIRVECQGCNNLTHKVEARSPYKYAPPYSDGRCKFNSPHHKGTCKFRNPKLKGVNYSD